jgi:hypothetical protein
MNWKDVDANDHGIFEVLVLSENMPRVLPKITKSLSHNSRPPTPESNSGTPGIEL